jgi:hypothetical protein
MNKLPGWEVTPTMKLPAGYTLREDSEFVYLCYQGEAIRGFMARTAAPEKIVREAEKHAREGG